MMMQLNLQFEVDPKVSADSMRTAIQSGLHASEAVASVTTATEKTRFTGLEILAAVSLTAQIVHHGRDIVHDTHEILVDAEAITAKLKAFFSQVIDFVHKTPGVQDASIDVGMKSLPLSRLTDDDIARIADAVLARIR